MTLHIRSFFYVDGSYDEDGVVHGQVYVEKLEPQSVTQPFPIVFIHGGGMTGTNFLNTPDGRPGWADQFMSSGFVVYLVDQPSRGRSPHQPNDPISPVGFSHHYVSTRFTATHQHSLWPQSKLHTQWPGSGTKGDPVFDAFFKSTFPTLPNGTEVSQRMVKAGEEMIDRIVAELQSQAQAQDQAQKARKEPGIIILTHSQSGQFGWLLVDRRPKIVKAIIALEPLGPPFVDAVFTNTGRVVRPFGITDIPVAYDPPLDDSQLLEGLPREVISYHPDINLTRILQPLGAPRRLANLTHIPVLLVTSESGYHTVYDDCTVEFLRQGGVSVKHLRLEELGLKGNGHMMFMERNSSEIAEIVISWLKTTL